MWFFDASSLVKRYLRETGTEQVDEIFEEEGKICVSWLSFAECLASFARGARNKIILAKDQSVAQERFLEDWEKFQIVRETIQLEEIVKIILKTQPLRGADAIQLATALFLKEHGLTFKFVCSDRRLANVAREEGLDTLTPGLN